MTGASYAMVARALQGYNDQLDKRNRVTIDSIRNHTARHFPVQHIARATYRDILEHRARENAVDFVNGVATAITPIAFLATVMVKSYATLVDSETKVDVNTGMIAASRLQSLLDSRAGQPDVVDMMLKVNRIIAAVKSTVPESMWPEISRKLDQPEQHHTLDVEAHAVDDADHGFDPTEFADIDDEL
ncbi:hypothetical protein [Mycobacterium sp.]|uniref:hypothetical protein n=1 Tax=Mycobacterium sp. TaxID=1785 RepID=UPI003C75C8B8